MMPAMYQPSPALWSPILDLAVPTPMPPVNHKSLHSQDGLADIRKPGQSPALPPRFAPLDWLFNPSKRRTRLDRVLAYLILAESKEVDPWYRDDYRQSFIALSLARKGSSIAFIQSSYTMYGCHPDRVWQNVLQTRKAKMGREYAAHFDAAGNLKPEIPKKPSASVKREAKEDAA